MFQLLRKLKPRYIFKEEVILNVMDEVLEIIFITRGQFKIGFEINRQMYFRMAITSGKRSLANTQGHSIGGYYVSFNKRSNYGYKASNDCSGFSLVKREWVNLLHDNPKISDFLVIKIKNQYEKIIHKNLKIAYKAKIDQLSKRSDLASFLRKVEID